MAEMDHLPGPIDTSVLYAQEGHRSQLVYVGQEIKVLKCWKHHRSLGGWPVNPRIVDYVHRAGLFHLTQVQWISDKTGNSVPLMYLPLLEDFDRAGRVSWGGATLAYLYRQLSIACKSDVKAICGSLTLLQLWSWERLHVGHHDIAMHPLPQDMLLGHRWNVLREEINNPRHVLRLYRSELDHQDDYQIEYLDSLVEYNLFLVLLMH
ncbi:hypothetical protein Taro_044977 [Colocasia esculenta]|uniref:Aminotransferase-like plant mobile domain-containing protein n=1 Tax=Colocasia esculenta TaxID=4460 RepID=A0A843WVX3_COLES|nr:hypothetical protein [Colocasia esculenta]